MAHHSQGTPGRMICPSQETPSRTTCPVREHLGRMAHHITVRRHREQQSVPGRGHLHEQPITARAFPDIAARSTGLVSFLPSLHCSWAVCLGFSSTSCTPLATVQPSEEVLSLPHALPPLRAAVGSCETPTFASSGIQLLIFKSHRDRVKVS